MTYRGTGPQTYTGIILISGLLMVASAVWYIPSPGIWPMQDWVSRLVNGLSIVGLSLWLWFLNKKYNFVKSSDYTLPCIFLITTAANPASGGELSASTLMLILWMGVLSVLFGCFRRKNSTQETFVVATFFSLGTMINTSFLLMIPMVYIAGTILKSIGFRETVAFGMGLIAPYWIGFGLGLMNPSALSLPRIENFFTGMQFSPGEMIMMAGAAALFLGALLGALGSIVKLYAGNPRSRAMNHTFIILSLYCVGCMIGDTSDFQAYLATLNASIAVMLANTLTLNNVPRTSLWIWILALLCIGYRILISIA